MSWSLNTWRPESYFNSYVKSHLFTNGHLDFEKLDKYGKLFGINEKDFRSDPTIKERQVAKFIFKKELAAYGGIDPTDPSNKLASVKLSEHKKLQRQGKDSLFAQDFMQKKNGQNRQDNSRKLNVVA